MNVKEIVPADNNAALLEKVITCGDLAGLKPIEKMAHIKNICDSLGLNPVTVPIQLIKFQGKEIAYFTRGATEQLRNTRKISIHKMENQIMSDIYIATAHASAPDGRMDMSTGAVSIAGLKGEALSNAIMKAETKAKRRVTLSICGLGMLDESEVESMKIMEKEQRYPHPVNNPTIVKIDKIEADGKAFDLKYDLEAIEKTDNIEQLETLYREKYKFYAMRKDHAGLEAIIKAKNDRKDSIQKTINEFLEEDIKQ